VIGGILEHVRISGFLGNLNALYEAADLEGNAWRKLVNVWWTEFRNQQKSTADLLEMAEEIEEFPITGNSEDSRKRSLGIKLGKQRDRVIDGFQIKKTTPLKGKSQWTLIVVGNG